MDVGFLILQPVPTNSCESATDSRTGDCADAPENKLQADAFSEPGKHAHCRAERNESDEDSFSHLVSGTSAGGYASIDCCNVDPVRHWSSYLSKLRKLSRTVAATSTLEMPKRRPKPSTTNDTSAGFDGRSPVFVNGPSVSVNSLLGGRTATIGA